MPTKNKRRHERPPFPRNISGKRIRQARLALKPTASQEDLAGRLAALGVSLTRGHIAKIETGRRPVLDYELKAIAMSLKTTPQVLLGI